MKLASLAAFSLISLLSATALAETTRILVSVGHNDGMQAEHALKYADTDAARVKSVLVGMGGVKPEDAFVVNQPSRAALFATIDKAKADAQKHKAADVTLVFYFSGHGDRDALHLGDERLLNTELSAKLAEVPAALRIVVTDACRTTRDKGFVADEPFAIAATSSVEATGQVWLNAASDGEAAQESDEVQGAIFTHAWLNGLRGAADANGDSRVTLDESFAFAHSQTMIRSAKSSGVVQKPEAVVNLRELAPVVLTTTAAKLGTISLPRSKDTHFLVYQQGGKGVLSELWGSGERRLALGVPPGRYVVMKRLGGAGSIATIAVGENEERKLEEVDFSRQSLESVAKKGEEDVARLPAVDEKRNELAAGYELGGDTRTGLTQGPRLGYTRVWGRVGLSVGAGADFASRTIGGNGEKLASGFGKLTIEFRVPVGPSVLRLGGGGRAGYLSQSLTEATKGSTNGAFLFGPEAFIGARTPFAANFFFDLSVTGSLMVLREESSARGIAGLTGGGALGSHF